NLRSDLLIAEPERIDRLLAPRGGDGFRRDVSQSLTGAHRGAHRALADRGPVVAHVGLHHLLVLRNELWNTEWTRRNAVGQTDTARLQRRADNAVVILLDGVGRTALGAGWVVAVPADICCRGDGLLAIDEIEVDHRHTPVGVAFLASLQAGLTPDASRRVDVE